MEEYTKEIISNKFYDKPLTIIAVRHGKRQDQDKEFLKSVENQKGINFYDSPLSYEGIKQTKITGLYLKDLTRSFKKIKIISSPYLRCLQTANEIAKALQQDEIFLEYSIGENSLFLFCQASKNCKSYFLKLSLTMAETILLHFPFDLKTKENAIQGQIPIFFKGEDKDRQRAESGQVDCVIMVHKMMWW